MSDYTEYFLNTFSNVGLFECVELSHPNFTQTYRLVRNAASGLTVTHEDASVHTYNYYPLQIQRKGAKANLDSTVQVNLGDLGEILPKEIDAVTAANGLGTKATMVDRCYRSDILSAPTDGPITFEVANFSFNGDGVSFEARAPRLNINLAGEFYTLDRFVTLSGFT